MPKRKRSDESATKDKPIVLTLHERWDVNRFNSIKELVLSPDVEEKLNAIAPSVNSQISGYRRVDYRAGKFETGRLYGQGLQSINRWIRRLCAGKYYSDIDIVNCGPTLFSQLLEMNGLKVPSLLKTYADDRDEMFRLVRQELPDVTDKQLKDMLLKLSHAGLPSDDDRTSTPFLVRYSKQVVDVANELKSTVPRYAELYQQRVDAKEYNQLGSFISCVWQESENKVLMELVKFFQDAGKMVGFLAFDGLGVEKHDNIDLGGAESAVFKKTGFRIKLAEKSLIPTEEDYQRYWGERAINKIVNPFMKQVYYLYRHAQLNGLKRQDGYSMTPHNAIPGVFVRADDADAYINSVLRDELGSAEVYIKKLGEWFDRTDHPMFQILTQAKMNHGVISFTNGYFDIDKVCFVEWGGPEPVPLTNHYFEQSLDMDAAAEAVTPLWDSLTTTQLGPRNKCDMCNRTAIYTDNTCEHHSEQESASLGFADPTVTDMLEIMIGRCFFPIGKYDNWQVNLFLKGDANTGKGTICDLIKHMFAVGATGTITATHEQNFGLEALYQKRLVVVPDMPKNFSKIVNQSDFQSMCSGEGVSIARKNKTAITSENWTVPIVFAANYLPDYSDHSGSVSRRLVVFLFNQLIESRNTMLKEEIIQKELVTVIVRCITAYRRITAQKASVDFWNKIAPSALREIQAETKAETNPLANFLRNGDNFYQVVKHDASVTPLSELEKAFSNHMRINHKVEKAKLGSDYHPLRNEGYKIECIHLCKECHQKSNKATCGSHYNKANRYKKVVVSGMMIRTR
jgi:hypothetical protein